MKSTSTGPRVPRDTAAKCRTRAAADRARADGMNRPRDRRDLEESAAGWDERGELLGRLEVSFDKRARLDAASKVFAAARQAAKAAADSLEAWEDEGGGTQAPPHGTSGTGV